MEKSKIVLLFLICFSLFAAEHRQNIGKKAKAVKKQWQLYKGKKK